MTDSLYGLTPDPTEDFGLHLGALAPRGERNVLVASLDSLLRASSNPFYPYMINRIDEGIGSRPVAAKATTSAPPPESNAEGDASDWSFRGIAAYIRGVVLGQSDGSDEAP